MDDGCSCKMAFDGMNDANEKELEGVLASFNLEFACILDFRQLATSGRNSLLHVLEHSVEKWLYYGSDGSISILLLYPVLADFLFSSLPVGLPLPLPSNGRFRALVKVSGASSLCLAVRRWLRASRCH